MEFEENTPEPDEISAWPFIIASLDHVTAESTLKITITPSGLEDMVSLNIENKEPDREEHPDWGELNQDNATTWVYEAFLEPQDDKSPPDHTITIGAWFEDNLCAEIEITVKPVFDYLNNLYDEEHNEILKYGDPEADEDYWDDWCKE